VSTARRTGSAVRDGGSITVEAAVLAPVLVLVLLLMIAAGRISLTGSTVDHAATAAARAASLARTPDAAQQAATDTARAALDEQHLTCSELSVTADTAGFARGPGQPAQVVVEVRCAAPLSDLGLPGLPGTVAQSSRFASPLDPYRSAAAAGFPTAELGPL
jgi:Flp pilus assembly protein TadG